MSNKPQKSRIPWQELTTAQQDQARTIFAPLVPYEYYSYNLGYDEWIISRIRLSTKDPYSQPDPTTKYDQE